MSASDFPAQTADFWFSSELSFCMVCAPAKRGHSAKQPTNWRDAPQLSLAGLAAWDWPRIGPRPVRSTTPRSRLQLELALNQGNVTSPGVPGGGRGGTRRATATTYPTTSANRRRHQDPSPFHRAGQGGFLGSFLPGDGPNSSQVS